MNEVKDAWGALGTEYHARLERNYVTWEKSYAGTMKTHIWGKEILKRSVHWTVSALMLMGAFYDDVVLATKLGIEIGLLPCRYFW